MQPKEQTTVPRLLGVCNRLMKNLEKTTLMQQHQQEILLGVQLEADRYKRHCNELKRELVQVKETIDSRMTNIEKVVSVEEKLKKVDVKTVSPTVVPVPRQQLSPTVVPVPRQQRLPKPVRSPHLKVSVTSKPTFSRK